MVDGAEALDGGPELDIASLGCAYFMVGAGIREAGRGLGAGRGLERPGVVSGGRGARAAGRVPGCRPAAPR
jgi:hypothetical protein